MPPPLPREWLSPLVEGFSRAGAEFPACKQNENKRLPRPRQLRRNKLMSRPGTRFADECAGHSAKHRLVKHSFEQVNTAWIVCTCKYWPAAGHNMPLQGYCDANLVGTAVRVGQDQWLTKAAQCSIYESPRVWSALLSAAGSISGVKTLSSLLPALKVE